MTVWLESSLCLILKFCIALSCRLVGRWTSVNWGTYRPYPNSGRRQKTPLWLDNGRCTRRVRQWQSKVVSFQWQKTETLVYLAASLTSWKCSYFQSEGFDIYTFKFPNTDTHIRCYLQNTYRQRDTKQLQMDRTREITFASILTD